MRVIRTEMYFNEVRSVADGASRASRLNPGIGIAFLGGDVSSNFPYRLLLSNPTTVQRSDDRLIRKFIDLSLRGVEKSYGHPSSKYWRQGIRNDDAIGYVLDSNIVIERSPPDWETLKSLISKSPGIGIGTFVGYELAGSNPKLLIFTVPIGIIVVSSAIGISKALEKGLNKKVENLLKGGQ